MEEESSLEELKLPTELSISFGAELRAREERKPRLRSSIAGVNSDWNLKNQ